MNILSTIQNFIYFQGDTNLLFLYTYHCSQIVDGIYPLHYTIL